MAQMESQHAMALGTTGLVPVAMVFQHWYQALQTLTLPPMDMNGAMAHAALIVWGVAFWAARKGVQLPPLNGSGGRGAPSSGV